MKRARSAVGAGLAMFLAACAANSVPDEPRYSPVEERPSMPTLETMTASVLDDAAKRTGLNRAALVVESAAAVTWADGSIGCPEPGMNYTMALVPGYRIIIRAGERRLDYHATRRGYFVLCPAGRSADPIGDAVR
jgi:hypothetical protein